MFGSGSCTQFFFANLNYIVMLHLLRMGRKKENNKVPASGKKNLFSQPQFDIRGGRNGAGNDI